MQKKTMWITAAALGAVLVLGGAGAAMASSDLFDDDGDRATSTSSGTTSGTDSSDRSRSDDSDDRSGSDDNGGNSGRDGSDDGTDDNGGDRDGSDNTVPATADQRSAAEAAALDEIGQGTVREFDTGDSDDDYAYKVELVMDDGSEVEVEFAADLTVLRIDRN